MFSEVRFPRDLPVHKGQVVADQGYLWPFLAAALPHISLSDCLMQSIG